MATAIRVIGALAGLLVALVVLAWLWLPGASDLAARLGGRRRRGAEGPPGTPVAREAEAVGTALAGEEEGRAPRLLFLVPAHDEEPLIEACARSVLAQDYPAGALDLVVIADNCADRTADRARTAGARCLERADPERPGKPAALAWAIESLPIGEWDLCVVLDADSVTEPGFARALAAVERPREAVLQTYLGMSNEWESWLTRLAGLQTRIRYDLAYPRKRAAGLNCPLTGNGMAFGAARLAREGWTAFSLTEDWELYARDTAEGVAIDYLPDARLRSLESASLRRAGTQRRRWTAGRLSVLRAWAVPLLRSRCIGLRQKLDAIAELAGPSPVLHAVFALALAALAWLFPPLPDLRALLPALALASLLPLALDTVGVLRHHPRPLSTLAAFLLLPLYASWRIVNAAYTLLTLPDTRWRKTERV